MATQPIQNTTPGRVLVVDDSRLVRAVVARYLGNAGFSIDEAANAEEALQRLSGSSFDVVITDLRMPGVGGLDLLASVKSVAPRVEVIILTASHVHDAAHAVQALRLGAHDYLTKPPASADVVLTVTRALEKKRLHETNERLLRELDSLSRTDGLTGVANRRSFDEALSQEIARAKRHGHSLGLALFDLDHFRKINEVHGHQGGDEALRTFARVVASKLREGDKVYRYGGEEFAVLLPNADADGALNAADRIVSAVAGSRFVMGSRRIALTVSAGVASLLPSDKKGTNLIARADAALYEAKRAGRNQAKAGQPHTLAARRAS